MEVEFKNKSKNLKERIDYGTILLCKYNKIDEDFILYRVASAMNADHFWTLYTLHIPGGNEKRIWGSEYDDIEEMIGSLKMQYDVIQVVDAHIVIDNIVGEL